MHRISTLTPYSANAISASEEFLQVHHNNTEKNKCIVGCVSSVFTWIDHQPMFLFNLTTHLNRGLSLIIRASVVTNVA